MEPPPQPQSSSPPLLHRSPGGAADPIPTPTRIQLPCARCKTVLNIRHGLSSIKCPRCSAVNHPGEEEEVKTVGETFTKYRPPRQPVGPPHPDPVVETSSLSAVRLPKVTYSLAIQDGLESSNTLSSLQAETLVYACQRHLQHLPGGERAGFFIGDGAGVGKGRTIAGLIWENWQHNRRKTLWISIGSDLKFDARRDLDDVGASCITVHALNKLPYSKLDSKSMGIEEGVIFSTYTSLIAHSQKGRSRLQQLVQWCGGDFDGLIIFDECHKAKNLFPGGRGEGSMTGKAVVDIQARLPLARVVYCSATGVSEPRNMAYMVRLGLWGFGTCFYRFSDFLADLEEGGVGALELVAMDMKARGMYVCRTLSHKGAEFEVVEVPLGEEMTEHYRKAAEFWADLREELLLAEARTENNENSIWRYYWGNHQRFFRHILMSAKVPAVVSLAKQALSDGKCVVIGLQSTGAAHTEEAVSKHGAQLDDFIFGPRELLLKFVEENYPLPEIPESRTKSERKRYPDVSLRGRVRKVAKVFGKTTSSEEDAPEIVTENEVVEVRRRYEAGEERKLRLLEKIRGLDLPNNPLDDIIDQLGGPENVAEITGRRGMLIRDGGGKGGVTYRARSTKDVTMEMVNIHEKGLFMDGKKLVAIISEAGSAGVSLQADRRALNQRRRVHLTLELPWSADRAVQQFGRTHRSNQASAPQYKLMITNLGGERRFASVVAKRLEMFGALTQGDRKAGGGPGPSLSVYNYDTPYGRKALKKMYKCMKKPDTLPVIPPGCSPENVNDFMIQAKTALSSVDINITYLHTPEADIARFLNRILGLPPEMQNRLFELFLRILDRIVEKARSAGKLDSGIVDMRGDRVEIVGEPKVVHVDRMSGVSTVLFKFSFEEFCEDGRSSRISEVNVLSGLILPIWRPIKKALPELDLIRAVRIQTTSEPPR